MMDLAVATDGTINCTLEPTNGAVFSMVLTEIGSDRLGVQDHVELRAGAGTVTIVNNCRYRAEVQDRVVRRARISRGKSYRQMYRGIVSDILKGRHGDTPQSLERSAGAVLELDELLAKARR